MVKQKTKNTRPTNMGKFPDDAVPLSGGANGLHDADRVRADQQWKPGYGILEQPNEGAHDARELRF